MKTFFQVLGWGAVITAFILAVAYYAPAAVSKKHGDSIGVVMYQTNPNSYIEGSVADVALVGKGVNIRIQPRGSYGLFSEDILFCDLKEVTGLFSGKTGPVVLVYETVTHRTIEDIGCHELRVVDQVKTTGGL